MGRADPAPAAASGDALPPSLPAERAYMPVRLGLGSVGLACLLPYLALRDAAGSADAVLLACTASPLLAAALASVPGGRDAGHLVTGAAAAGLAAIGLAGFGPAAWPLAALACLEPAVALLCGRARPAFCALAGSALGFAIAALAFRGGRLGPHDAGAVAAGFLLLQALALSGAAAWSRTVPDSPEGARAPSSPSADVVPLAAISDLVTWHDAFGDVLRASAAAFATLGAAPRGLLGAGLLARVHLGDRPGVLTALSDAANGTEPVRVRFRVHPEAPGAGRDEDAPAPTAGAICVEMRAHRLAEPGPGGAVVVAFTRDISAETRHAAELEAARAEAERANDLKGSFLATVSHELRTPLNAIIGFAELLSADHPFLITAERQKEYAVIIRNSGHHLLELVNTLLDMSKIETGNFTFDPEPFSLRELAVSCCDLIQLKADGAGVTIERRLGADLPEITADRRACRQILINLVSNAVKFTKAGGQVTVDLSLAGEMLVLCVTDTGIGIPKADLPRLGDPFFQSGDVHRRNHEGTGLGLSVVRGLVGLHGGRLVIESEAGIGTAVTVSLPVTGGADPKSAKPATVTTFPRVPARAPERLSA